MALCTPGATIQICESNGKWSHDRCWTFDGHCGSMSEIISERQKVQRISWFLIKEAAADGRCLWTNVGFSKTIIRAIIPFVYKKVTNSWSTAWTSLVYYNCCWLLKIEKRLKSFKVIDKENTTSDIMIFKGTLDYVSQIWNYNLLRYFYCLIFVSTAIEV
ncbi:hypothetical protein Tco_1037381 [Tanacetum coccineum]